VVEAICDGSHPPYSAAALGAQRAAVQQLRQLVAAYARHLKERGLPPERTVGFVKALVRETDVPCGRPLLSLESDVVRWCIEAYYADGEAPAGDQG